MTKTHRSRPWHEVVCLEEEFSNGELSLAQLAADLHEVTLAPGWDGRVFAEIQENITGRLNIQNHIGVHGCASAPRRRALV